MSVIVVPNLSTYTYTIPSDKMLVFPHDKHRTRFIIQDRSVQIISFWVGAIPAPPADLSLWIELGGNQRPDVINFEYGIAGPVYILEPTGVGEVVVLSPLLEQATLEDRPT